MFFFSDSTMSNKRFYFVCEKYIKFNNEFNRHLISCDYAHEKKSSRFMFHDTYLKKNKINDLRRHIEEKKNENKTLQLFINDLKTLKKHTQYTTKIVTIENIQKHNKIYDENLKFNETFFKNNVNRVVQSARF